MIEELRQYSPTQPLPVLVAELNKFYHEAEASQYEKIHPEIFEQLPRFWKDMLAEFDSLGRERRGRKLRILNLGSGTGFEARQCLEYFGRERVGHLVCCDPSAQMLEQSRRTLSPWGGLVQYVDALDERVGLNPKFDLLITNAVLHHMVDPVQVIREIVPLLDAEAVWLAGHEPSRLFYSNRECVSILRRYNAYDRWVRLASPRRCSLRILRWFGLAELPADYAGRRAVEQSLFGQRPPARLVSRLVDYQIVLRETEIEATRGLDFMELQSAFAREWQLVRPMTYSFLGPHYEGGLPARWQKEARRLAESYPNDGANCCMVWRRAHSLMQLMASYVCRVLYGYRML